jgi:hypothetical protein
LRRPGAWESEAEADDSPGAAPLVLRLFGAITVRVLWFVQDLNPTPHESAVLSRDRAGETNRAMSDVDCIGESDVIEAGLVSLHFMWPYPKIKGSTDVASHNRDTVRTGRREGEA